MLVQGGADISFEDEPQPLEREPRIVVVDALAVRDHHGREATGGDDDCALPELCLQSMDELIDLTGRTPELDDPDEPAGIELELTDDLVVELTGVPPAPGFRGWLEDAV